MQRNIQQAIVFKDNKGTININPPPDYSNESKDEIIKFRVESTRLQNLKAKAFDRKQNLSQLLTDFANIGELYIDFMDTMLDHQNRDCIFSMLKRLSQKF